MAGCGSPATVAPVAEAATIAYPPADEQGGRDQGATRRAADQKLFDQAKACHDYISEITGTEPSSRGKQRTPAVTQGSLGPVAGDRPPAT